MRESPIAPVHLNPTLPPMSFLRFFSLIALLHLGAARAAEWPEWRGPGGAGHASARNLPVEWSGTDNVTWKTPIPGRGWSSPVIAGNQIWMSTAIETPAKPEDVKRRLKDNTGDQPLVLLEKVELRAICVDRRTGKLLHNVLLLTEREPQWVHELNSYASPTPVLETGRAYFHFGAFGTACLDTRTALVVWTNTALPIMHENGPGSSPILWRHLLIFNLDGSDTQSVVALDKANGKVVWRTPRSGEMPQNGQLKKSYATPAIVTVDGHEQLFSQGSEWLYGYDPADGRELWKIKYGLQGFSHSARAVFGHGMMFLSTGFMRPEIQAVRFGGGKTPAHAWRYAKGAPTMSSPLLVGDELYFVSDSGGMFTCLDAHSGKEIYRERLGGNFSSSPLYADGRIYLASREGVTSVIEPGRQFKVLATNTLPGKIMATPAAVDRALYLRTDAALYRLETNVK